MQNLTAPELAAWLADPARTRPCLVDVREPWEFATAHIAGASLVPMREVPQRLAELPADVPLVCICHHGMRSQQVAMFLARQGFEQVVNIAGGIHAWSMELDPSIAQY